MPLFAIDLALSLVFPHRGFFFSGATMRAPGWLVFGVLSLSYFFVCEARSGQTIGKRRRGRRVRSASGGRAGINAVSARNVLRAQLAAGTLLARYLPGGAVLVGSPDGGVQLVAIPEGGHLKLDVRGIEKVDFLKGCTAGGRLTQCGCTFTLLRLEGELPEGTTPTVGQGRAIDAAASRCKGGSSAALTTK